MAQLLKGAPAASALTESLAKRAAALTEKGVVPVLAILRIGVNESDIAYERGILKRCEKIGIRPELTILPADTTQEKVLSEIRRINEDPSVHGCIMFRPLPKHLNEAEICASLDVRKDVDCMTESSLTHVFTGRGSGFAPCTAESCIEILRFYGYDLKGKTAAVIGRSLVIGKPVSMLLLAENATVTMCHTKTADMPSVCRDKDFLIVAAGKAGIVDASFTNPKQVIIDVGINTDSEGNLCGDVDLASAEPACAAITPVPGGVGSVTTAILCRHVIEAAEDLS